MSAQLGLYYPFIHFRNESWLKLTSLYWDRMGRIVPAGYGLRDSQSVREFRDGGYVIDCHPGGSAQAETSEVFQAVMARYGERLAIRYGLHLASDWPDEPATVSSRAAEFGNPKLAYIYSQKLSVGLIEDLVSLGLAEEGGRREPHWVGMHPKLAAIYMTTLADALATRRRAVPVSDDLLSHVALGDATMDGMAAALLNEREEASTSGPQMPLMMANLAISTVVPADMQSIPTGKLIAFRERYALERVAFQDQVDSMVSALAVENVAEPGALEDCLRVEYETRLKPHVADLERRLRGAKIDTTTAIFNIKTIPTGGMMEIAAEKYLSTPQVFLGGAAVALGLWGVERSHRQTRRSMLAENRAASYLYQIDANLNPQGLTNKITALGRRFWS